MPLHPILNSLLPEYHTKLGVTRNIEKLLGNTSFVDF